MTAATITAYVATGLTALAIGAFVFFLFPARKPALDNGGQTVSKVDPIQQSSFSQSLIGAAPRGYVGWIDRQIAFAGRPMGWTVNRIFGWKVVLTIAGLFFGLLLLVNGPDALKILLAVFIVVLMFFVPDVLINSRAHDRTEKIKYGLPDTLDQMTIAVEAGLGFDAAMAKAARNGNGPLAEELVRVLQDMSIGRTRRDAFLELERRTNTEDLRRFVRAIIQADAYGVAIGDVLRVQAAEMRTKRRQRAEEQAMKVTVKIIFPLVLCLLPVLFIVVMTPGVLGIINAFSR